MFEPLPAAFDFPRSELEVLEFWEREQIFRRSMEQRRGGPMFVFYEGPPTANGLPHPGHCLTRAMKDLFPRYKTMCGFLVERKAGWDTHGLPVEREVCKELGIRTKQQIEAYGVEKFNLHCIRSVFRYTREWEEMTRRLGFWVNLQEAYVTFHQSYVESVWWSLKRLFERGLLYQGHKVVWWWAQGGTALSSGEVGEGRRTVDDPGVFVKFPLSDAADARAARTSLLVWTTTPWTLISNQFAAVNPELEYALVEDPGLDGSAAERLYLAAALAETIGKKLKRELRVVSTCKGSALVGLRYIPPFVEAYYQRPLRAIEGLSQSARAADVDQPLGHSRAALAAGGSAAAFWRVLAADFVSLEAGTGLVHEAPAFGEDDFNLLQAERQRFTDPGALPVLCAVNPDGTFNADAPERYRGRWVKDCDKEIIRELRDERKTPWGTPLLLHQEQYRHEYPFCPQAPDDPLIQYARKSWFVRTSQFKQDFVDNNANIHWVPEHIRDGRFGNFLRGNVDWALSRERYWGTPLPIWQCEKCGQMQAIGSFAELQARPQATDNGYWEQKRAEHAQEAHEFPEHLRVHKPYIDQWTYACEACAASAATAAAPRMRRVPEVIDCWWDAGSMPFAQWGFPHVVGSAGLVRERWPADFISEALDQTRGWFYGLLAISTLLREDIRRESGAAGDYPLPYRNVVCLGLIKGEDGQKMSKKLRNYPAPSRIFDRHGADAMRWYLLGTQSADEPATFADVSEEDVRRFRSDEAFREEVRARRQNPKLAAIERDEPIRDAASGFLVKLHNVLSFFVIYSNIDGFDPSRRDEPGNPMGHRPTAQRSELDRWIVSELSRTVSSVRSELDRFENFPAAQRLAEFVDALSNWFVRRSRDRFWRPFERGDRSRAADGAFAAADQDKWDAYHTLYGCLRVFSRLIAPFTPFYAETMHRTLRVGDDPISVHLCDYPKAEDIGYCDDALSDRMSIVREIASLGRAARAGASDVRLRRVRQPLARVEIILTRPAHREWLDGHRELIMEELNVKLVEYTSHAEHYVSYKVAPNFPAIGKKYRALVPGIKEALSKLPDAAAARQQLLAEGSLALQLGTETVRLGSEEVEIRMEAKPGWSAAQGKAGVVVVSNELSDELLLEGRVRELIHHVQTMRKELDLPYQARIRVTLDAADAVARQLQAWTDELSRECLASRVAFGPLAEGAKVLDIDGQRVKVGVEVDR